MKTLLELAPGECKWPQSELKQGEYLFCAASAQAGVYCSEHRKLAFVKDSRKKDPFKQAFAPSPPTYNKSSKPIAKLFPKEQGDE